MFRMALVLAVSSLALGCAEPEPSMLINGHVFWEGGTLELPDEMDEDQRPIIDLTACVAKNFDDDHTVATRLFADVSYALPDVAIVMKNRLADTREYAPIGTEEQLRTDSNAILLENMVVTFDEDGPFGNIGDGGVLDNPFGTLLRSDGDFHFAGELTTRDIRDDLESATSSAAGGDAIVPSFVDIQILGRTTGGTDVESNILTIPVEFCSGCSPPIDTQQGPIKSATLFCKLDAG